MKKKTKTKDEENIEQAFNELEGEKPEVIGNIHEPIKGSAVAIFREKCDIAMARIKNLKQFRESDTMVDYVFRVGRQLFDTPLDQMPPDSLIRTGGKLTGAFGYLGQKSSYARAERDVYEQKASEVSKEIVLKYLSDGRYKVTQAKAEAELETSELHEFVITKDAEKNQWENLIEATQSMISFIQSAIKVKESERFHSKQK
jgi:hypothetical protein